jgi:hypothetical protein
MRLPRYFPRFLFLRGDSELSVVLGLGVASLFAVALGGLFYTPEKSQTPVSVTTTTTDYTNWKCCDTGDGNACTTVPGNTITYNGNTYGLIRSNMYPTEGKHIKPTGQRIPTGEQIFNIVDSGGGDPGWEPRSGKDILWGSLNSDDGPQIIDQGSLIYVCRSGDEACSKDAGTAVFDGYWKIGTPIANGIKNCTKRDPVNNPNHPKIQPGTGQAEATGGQQVIVTPTQSASKNSLQIGTFSVTSQNSNGYYADWLTPYCKPAIYLYPQQVTDVHVVLNPIGKLNLTIPQYPKLGWDVTVSPNGNIVSNGQQYDYLYYEAKLPDEKIIPPSDGFVVSYQDLASRLPQIVTAYGLNTKEKDQFVEYWLKVLPHAPYYFIGVMPEAELDRLSPLSITPHPDHVRRLTLYFQALQKKEDVSSPAPFATFSRSGFSVVEWGGIFKKDPKYPFSCFM